MQHFNLTRRILFAAVCILFAGATSFAQYCIPDYTTGTVEGDYLDIFSLGTIYNATGAGAEYNDYTAMSTDLTPGMTYTATITNTPTWNENYQIWIDYNHDFVFDASESTSALSLTPGSTGSISFTVPYTAITGTTVLRVRCIYSGVAPYDPCGLYTYGETEDYSVNLLPGATNDIGVTAITAPVTGGGLTGAESITVNVHNFGTADASEFYLQYSIDGGGMITEPYGGTLASGADASFTFATTANLEADGCYSITANTNWDMDEVLVNDATTASVCNLCTAAGNIYYVYSNTTGGQPWFTTTNSTAMDQVFTPGGWSTAYYETLDPASVFSAATTFVFLEGSDQHANELETFLTANMSTIEDWVAAGGRLFLNAAPNEGDGMSFGFGGVNLQYAYYTSNATAVDPAHPIFNGPYTPIVTDYTGSSFGHALVTGGGITGLIEDAFAPGNYVCAEMAWGSGLVVFGGMTTNNFHTPLLEAANLRANILSYASCGTPPPTCEIPSGLYVDGITDNDAVLHWTAVDGADQYRVTLQNTATGLIKTKGFYTNEVAITDKLTPLTTYAFRVKTVCYDDLGMISMPSEWVYWTTLGRMGDDNASVVLFPNPNAGEFTLQLNSLDATAFDVNIYDAVGHMVYSKTITPNSNSYTEQVSLDVPAGVYQVSISNGTSLMNYPVVINR